MPPNTMHPHFAELDNRLNNLSLVALEQATAIGARLGGWLLAGNAAALVLLTTAIVQGTSCELKPLLDAMVNFAAGMGCAFAGGVASYMVGLAAVRWFARASKAMTEVRVNTDLADDREQQNIPVPPVIVQSRDDGEAQLARMAKTNWLLIGAIPIMFYGASIVFFAMGVGGPLIDGSAAFSACGRAYGG